MGGEWKVNSCSSESHVHKADNVLLQELYRIWQTEEPSEEAWLVLQTDHPKAFERLEIVNAGASLMELYGSPEDGCEEELLLSTQQVMTLKDLTNKAYRNRSFTYAIPQKLSPIAAQKRWKQLRIACRQPFGTSEHRACIGLSRIDVISCNTEDSGSEVRKVCSADKLSGVHGSYPSVTCSTNKRLVDGKDDRGDDKKQKLSVCNFATENSTEDSQGKTVSNACSSEERKDKQISESSEGTGKYARNDHTGKGTHIESKDDIPLRDEKKINSLSSSKTTVQEKKQKRSSNEKDTTNNVFVASPSHKPILSGSSAKGKETDQTQSKPDLGSFATLLDGVVFAISGLVNPERGNLRSQGIEMGAEYQPDWNPNCSILVCAFPNTPKYRQVKGDGGTIVFKDWITKCYKQRKLVDIDPYLMHVGKPWRKMQSLNVSPVSVPGKQTEETKKKLQLGGRTVSARIDKKEKGIDVQSSEKLDFNPSEVQKWAVEDFNATVSWLEGLPEKPKPSELKETAIDGIQACLEETAKCLEGNKPVHTVLDNWEFIPQVVKELAALEDPRKGSQKVSREELCKRAVTYKNIYATELENMRRVIQQNKGKLQTESAYQPSAALDRSKAILKNSRLSDALKSDTDSDDTIVMGEDELDEA
ncbi:hypothetical protein KI387_008944 [Taxus chinensis]|uniref:BRCT domain-containing protein n=1 Tax=Taxus chinensis TaxID=29808 RepID=A0AA38FJ33_TAXCH|nr:hypothetical protein KI387_008944 [Taxus chinensis]